jgi:hypothetical protein
MFLCLQAQFICSSLSAPFDPFLQLRFVKIKPFAPFVYRQLLVADLTVQGGNR